MRGANIIPGLLDMKTVEHGLPWESYKQPGREGVEIVPLYMTSDTGADGPAAALVRYQPGAQVKRHRHPGYELILVLSGELINDTGRHPPGTLEICPPDSTHALSSETGCVFLVVWEKPVQVVDRAVDPAALALADG